MHTDILIIGAGPAGIFTAMELLRQGKVAWRPGFDGEYGKLSFPGA
jgi:thioredoxin reductase